MIISMNAKEILLRTIMYFGTIVKCCIIIEQY